MGSNPMRGATFKLQNARTTVSPEQCGGCVISIDKAAVGKAVGVAIRSFSMFLKLKWYKRSAHNGEKAGSNPCQGHHIQR